MIKKPSILLADEPLSLDDATAEIVFKNIMIYQKKNNTLTIIATHNISFINKLSMFVLKFQRKLLEIS